ncbi:MAG: PP0621 family protein [Pseudomonadota bacterium]|nr:PP0621 family protein [Pseudomonadota bacterium]
MRAIVFLLFVILVFFILRFTINRIITIREQNRQKQELQQSKQASSKESPQAMVRCAECGIHLPQSEAYYDGKDTFCSEGHMQSFHQKDRDSQKKGAQGDFQGDRDKKDMDDSGD